MSLKHDFLEKVKEYGLFNAEVCLNCGTCTGICPIEDPLLPRELMRFAALGLDEKIRVNYETIFSCLLCKKCEENCPAEVKITECIRTLRNYINRDVYKIK